MSNRRDAGELRRRSRNIPKYAPCSCSLIGKAPRWYRGESRIVTCHEHNLENRAIRVSSPPAKRVVLLGIRFEYVVLRQSSMLSGKGAALIRQLNQVRILTSVHKKRKMKEIVKGSFESSKLMLRGRASSPKGRSSWRGRAAQVYIYFTKRLTKAKSTM